MRLTRWLAALACALCAAQPSNATQAARGFFEDGVAAYRDGAFARAEALWLSALSAPDASTALDRAVLLGDLGNAVARQERWLEAVGWYTSALRHAPRDADLRHNLEFARGKANLAPADRGDLTSTLERFIGRWTLGETELGALAAAACLLGALLFEALRGGALAKRLLTAAVCLALAALVPWWYVAARESRDAWLVIAPGGAAHKSEPRAEAVTQSHLAAGTEVERRDALPGWVRVTSEGQAGWVRADEVFALRR